MKLQNIKEYIPAGGLYSSHEWYISCAGQLEKILKVRYGKRELLDFTNPPFFGTKEKYENWQERQANEVKDRIDVLFIVNDESYARIYKALTEDYNPLWNVDGTETLEYTRENTGTQSNVVGHTGDIETDRSNTGTQGNVINNTGTQTNNINNTGTQTTADSTGSTSTTYATTYNSSAEQETGKTVTQNSGQLTRTDNLTEAGIRTDNLQQSGTRTDNLREQTTVSNDLIDDALRTDDLNEHYKEVKIRGGNIGVTMSQQLIDAEIKLRTSNKFIEIVCNDIIKEICYT